MVAIDAFAVLTIFALAWIRVMKRFAGAAAIAAAMVIVFSELNLITMVMMPAPQPPLNARLAERVDGKRPCNESTIAPQAPAIRMDAIEREGPMVLADARELGKASEAGAARPAEVDVRSVPTEAGDIVRGQRPRTDRAHLAAKNVDELRQLVEAGGTKQTPHPRDPPVAHRSEFENVERPPAVADALLPEQDGAAVVDQHGGGDHRHHRRKYRQACRGPHHVEQPLRAGNGRSLHVFR